LSLLGIAAVIFGILFAVLPLPGTVSVLMYHFVGSDQDAKDNKNYVSERMLAEEMAFLKTFGYRVISLDEYNDILSGKKKSRGKEVVITFDDGSYTFFTRALPIFERYQFPVTVFLVTDYVTRHLGGSMQEGMINELLKKKWFHIGSHSKTHMSLTGVDDVQLREEMEGSKRELERLFKAPIHYFAYPTGSFDGRVLHAAQNAEYRLAFTTSPKKLKGIPEGRFCLTRTKISIDADHPLAFWAHVSGMYQNFKRWRQWLKKDAAEIQPNKDMEAT
jgi:peptidoglycan/xylan/chitin deacetylase (PgdA/CDA1 family)